MFANLTESESKRRTKTNVYFEQKEGLFDILGIESHLNEIMSINKIKFANKNVSYYFDMGILFDVRT